MSLFPFMCSGVLRRSPNSTLRVTDEECMVLADAGNAGREDYRLSVALVSGTEVASRTYAKSDEYTRDKRALHILIQPSP